MTILLALSCFGNQAPKDRPQDDSSTDDTEDSGTPLSDCEVLELEERAFDATEPEKWQRHQPAGDFSLDLRDGSTWTLSEHWTGCDTYVFVPHYFDISDLNGDSWWTTGVADLLERSPRNVHYFFVIAGLSSGDAEEYGEAMDTEIDLALADLDDEDVDWWAERLHVVDGPSLATEGIVREMFKDSIGIYGFGIDRYQKIRTLGSFAAVEAYSSTLSNQGYWPWETRLYSVAGEPVYWNFEVEREDRLAAIETTVVRVVSPDEVQAQYVDAEVEIPDVSGFDSLEIDIRIECPERSKQEVGNCGDWDYLANAWLWDETTESWLEMARFITTYHRESRWVVDATHTLAWLGDGGGTRTMRFSWAPSWNTQPSYITFDLRFSNQGKGIRPSEVVPLWSGGSFGSSYNEDRPPAEVEIPADAAKVELRAITTGHGMDTNNCAEFCAHSHHFTVGGTTWDQEFPAVSQEDGCSTTVDSGTVPNQAGTWWFGRGGWCPGRRVDPFVVDVTADLSPGDTATFAYEAKMNGQEPKDGMGNIELRSWAVIYR